MRKDTLLLMVIAIDSGFGFGRSVSWASSFCAKRVGVKREERAAAVVSVPVRRRKLRRFRSVELVLRSEPLRRQWEHKGVTPVSIIFLLTTVVDYL